MQVSGVRRGRLAIARAFCWCELPAGDGIMHTKLAFIWPCWP